MRTLATAVLLVFVVASVGYMVASEARSSSKTPRQGLSADSGALPSGEGPKAQKAALDSMNARQAVLVAYYFPGTTRCPTCLKMEQYARETIQEAFAAERTAGLIEWRAVNYDKHENEHYIRDFGLTASALVVVEAASTTSQTWRVLGHLWKL